ncbi:MAG: hypothetical protein ACREQ8_09985 [Woeseiaceae bacterium]
MEPFYFGERRLLGLYHPPEGPARGNGVLICPPVLGEYMRTHGCLRHLAIELAARGNHVLRFDYSCTGDSSGIIQEASTIAWREDILHANKELQEISGVTSVTIIGVRLGATLALSAANDGLAARHLVLWDPIEDGSDYLKELYATYEALIASHWHLTSSDLQEARHSRTGYALGDPLLQGIASLHVADPASNVQRLTVLLTEKAQFESGRWQRRTGDCHFVDHDCDWGTYAERAIFGRPVIEELAQRV